ncbi:MAG TPA: S41 family peptidase [Allosphingosinicella sp.]|jgi:C-terminal processing protease CtpA/Prc
MAGRQRTFSASLALVAALAACGGGGGGNPPPDNGGGATPPPVSTPPPAAPAACSLRGRQDWALAQIQEHHLFPELLATNVNPDSYSDVQSYIDALVAPARAQNKDRIFTYISPLADDIAFLTTGSGAGFGMRLANDVASGRVFIAEAFEGGPALGANIDRGTELLAIGPTLAELRTVSSILATEGEAGVFAALGPATAGLARVVRVRDPNGTTRDVTLVKATYTLDPVSDRYGALILNDGGKKVGYVNFRTFIGAPAEADLRAAFAQFKAQGVTEVIVDLRYNGGGLINTAVLFANLLLGNRSPSDVVLSRMFRPSKSANNNSAFFAPQPESIVATKVAFIGTGSTASSSEMLMNAVLPYLGANAALIGSNTFGKPVGQVFLDRPACDDRLRVIAFAVTDKNGQSDYFNGIASRFQSTCAAADEVTRPFGDPQEASIRTALDFLAGRKCTPIGGGAAAQSLSVKGEGAPKLMSPARPSGSERDLPGAF